MIVRQQTAQGFFTNAMTLRPVGRHELVVGPNGWLNVSVTFDMFMIPTYTVTERSQHAVYERSFQWQHFHDAVPGIWGIWGKVPQECSHHATEVSARLHIPRQHSPFRYTVRFGRAYSGDDQAPLELLRLLADLK